MKDKISEILLAVLALAFIAGIVVVCCYGCNQTEETERTKVKAGLVEKPMQYQHWEKP